MTITEAQNKHTPMLLGLPNVVIVAQGEKKRKGRGTGVPAIVVFVKKKIPEVALDPSYVIPKTLEGYSTDVVESGSDMALRTYEYLLLNGRLS